jgi:hypothetical protein
MIVIIIVIQMFDRFSFCLYVVGNVGIMSFGLSLLPHDKAKLQYLLDAVMNIDIFVQSVYKECTRQDDGV